MTKVEAAKAAHMADASSRWDDAIKRITPLLKADQDEGALVRDLTRLMFTADEATRLRLFSPMGGRPGESELLQNYGCTYSLLSLFELAAFFVEHEILDDGDVCLGYTRNTMSDVPGIHNERARCGPDDEGAEPYFCRSLDWARRDYPDTKPLTLESAIGAFIFYEEKRADLGRKLQARVDASRTTLSDRIISRLEKRAASYLQPSPQQVEWTAIINEISKETPCLD